MRGSTSADRGSALGRLARRVVRALGCLFLMLVSVGVIATPGTALANGWSTMKLPQPLNNQVALTDGSQLFILGGENAGQTGAVATVYGASASGGTLGTWQTFPALPQALYNHAGVLQNGYAVILGGQSSSNAAQATVYSAAVQSGAIGSWSATTSLPAARYDLEAVASGGFVYALGGFSSTNAASANVYRATQSGGTLSSWSSQTALPQAFGEFGADVANGRIYVAGGHTAIGNTGVGLSTVYSATIGTGGALGSWSTLTPLPQALWDLRLVAANGYLFAIGGYNKTSSGAIVTTKGIYRAPINGDGTIGSWLALTPLPSNVAEHTATNINGYLYVAGSKASGTASSANIFSAPVAGPWVMLSTYTTAAGTSVQVSGTGFAGGETVNITFVSTPVATATADASGSFGIAGSSSPAATFTVPASTANGTYRVTGKGKTSGKSGWALLTISGSSPPPTSDQWKTYLYDSNHTAYNSAFNAFGVSNAGSITKKFGYWLNGQVVDNPAVATITSVPSGSCAGSNVPITYAGSFNTGGSTTNLPGYLYALNANTGALCWRTYLATDTNPNPNSNCINSSGIASSPTVSTVSIGGTSTQVVYVGASDIMFALNAATGAVVWHTPLAGADVGTFSNAYIWSSPVYSAANNTLYTSTASFCDETSPIPGQLFTLNPSTGAIMKTWTTFSDGTNGGGIWGSPTVSASQQTVYVATGNGFTPNQGCTTAEPMSCAIVALDWNALTVKASWQVPTSEFVADGDFGSTPVLFPGPNGATWLAASNKNGHLYILDTANLAAGPKFDLKMAIGSDNPVGGIIAPTSYYPGTITDGGTSCTGVLFLATGHVTVNGTTYGGSISAICSLTGQILWRQLTSGFIYGAPSIANGLVTDGNGTIFEIRNWSTGALLFSDTVALIEGAASFANGRVYFCSTDHRVYSFGL